jgi:phage recombination protein Bet
MSKETSLVERVSQEIAFELKNEKAIKVLIATTFKDFDVEMVKQALFEGMMRGFSFKDFVEKKVYALRFYNNKAGKYEYSLVTSIDHIREIAMKNGQCGKGSPVYTFKADGKVETCEIYVERNSNGVVGKYSALVYFDEFNTSKNLWTSKPKMMIAKVAEAHALRQAFPEELSKYYTEEEMQKEVDNSKPQVAVVIDSSKAIAKLKAAKTGEELSKVWANLSADERRIEEVLFTYNEEVRSHDNP